MATAAPTSSISRSTTRRHRSSTFAPTPSATPYDNTSERRADSQRTNKILIGVFSVVGVVFLGLIAFQLYRCSKRRRKSNSAPLPPPRQTTMSEINRRNSRMVSTYGDYPTADFSRPPSVFKDQSFGSRSAYGATPSLQSHAASTELLGAEDAAKKSLEVLARSGHATRESMSDNSLSGPTMAPNDEEASRRLSPLGSRSQSPSNTSIPRPASVAQVHPRSDSRARHHRPNSVASISRHSTLGVGPRQQRHSTYVNPNRNSYYATGNYGAPHSPQVRDRLGLVMPQPLAPELFNYALSGRHDMGLDFMHGAWGSQGNLGQGDSDQHLAPPRRARTDSWVTRGHTESPGDSPPTSNSPLPQSNDGSLPRGRSTRPDVPRP